VTAQPIPNDQQLSRKVAQQMFQKLHLSFAKTRSPGGIDFSAI
jgi:hypothetical protein